MSCSIETSASRWDPRRAALGLLVVAWGVQAIVTSSGINDSGLFEQGRDERYRPFEGAGAVSSWRIELPEKHRPFDYRTISDVVLHLQYTARDGGGTFRSAAAARVDEVMPGSQSLEIDVTLYCRSLS